MWLTLRLLLFPAADSVPHILIPFVFQLHQSSFTGIQSLSSAELDKTFSVSKIFVELEPRTLKVEDFLSMRSAIQLTAIVISVHWRLVVTLFEYFLNYD